MSADCPVSSCSLKEEGCSQPLVSSYIQIDISPTFAVSALTTVKAGYVVVFCYSCEIQVGGGPYSYLKDKIKVEALKDCSGTLKDIGFPNPSPVTYNS